MELHGSVFHCTSDSDEVGVFLFYFRILVG